jgi:prevent-host-death family protein
MKTVGAYEAKTHLSRLLEKVAKGERIRITRHGAAVAFLVPPLPDTRTSVADTVASLRAFRAGSRLGRGSLKAMIEKGRR